MTRSGRGADLAFAAILVAYVVYGLTFIARASFVVDGTRYFSLFDDAMISMQYARNLVEHGALVWSLDAVPVEGFSNPLWVLYMACWHALPISTAKLSLPIQLTGLGLGVACLPLVRRISASLCGNRPIVWIPAVVLSATYLPFQFWALRGMEPPLIALLILLAVWRAVAGAPEDPPGRTLWLALGLGLLVRIDFAVAYGGVVLYLLASRRGQWQRILWHAVVVFVAAVGSWTAFRYAYYGDWLPNTYYLKVAGIPWHFRAQQGAVMALEFIRGMSYPVFALLFVGLVYRGRDLRVWLLAGLFLLQLLYSIHVGGDAWEWWGHGANRFVVVAMPLFFILASLALAEIAEWVGRWLPWRPARWAPTAISLAVAGMIVLLHGGTSGVLFRDLVRARGLYVDADASQVRYALRLAEITSPEARIAVAWGGAIPYFSRRPAVDLLGKNDAHVARIRPRVRSRHQVDPGHNKFDFGYSIGRLAPDVVAHSYHREDDVYLRASYRAYRRTDERLADEQSPDVFLRIGSANIRWDAVRRSDWIVPQIAD